MQNEPQLSAEKRFEDDWKDKIELKPFTEEEDAIYQRIVDKQVTYYPPRIKTVEELSRYLHVSPDRKLYLYPSPADDYKEWGNENHRKAFVQLVEAFLATALEEQKKTYEEQIKELSYKTGIIEVYARFDDLTKQRVVTQDVLAILKGSE